MMIKFRTASISLLINLGRTCFFNAFAEIMALITVVPIDNADKFRCNWDPKTYFSDSEFHLKGKNPKIQPHIIVNFSMTLASFCWVFTGFLYFKDILFGLIGRHEKELTMYVG